MKPADKVRKRDPSLDIIRICAFLFVVSVHFFLKCGFYDTVVAGNGMLLAIFARSFFMICVPLFMVLTGYLTSEKTACWAYYRKLVDTIGVYVLAALCCKGYLIFCGKEDYQTCQVVSDILNYSAAPYGWYVEMYIGLFLLCPFLNVAYKALGEKRKKQSLLAVLLLMTALPQVVNAYRPWLSWFRNPTSSQDYFQILPDYWTSLYPFLYYYIGSYIREYGISLSPLKALLLSIATALFQGLFNIWRNYGIRFQWGAWQGHGSLFVVVQTVLFFVMIQNLDLSRLPAGVCRCLSRISGLCFGAYLVSFIFDDYFYTRLNAAISYVPFRFPYFFVGVPLICVCSLLLSFGVNLCYTLLKKCVLYIGRWIRQKPFVMQP